MSDHWSQPSFIRLSGHGAAQAAGICAPIGTSRAAPTVALSRKVSDTFTTKFWPIAGHELIIGGGTLMAETDMFNLIGMKFRGTRKKANGPAAGLSIKHTTVEVNLFNIIGTLATSIWWNCANFERTQEVVTSNVRNTEGYHTGARGWLIPFKSVLPDIKVFAVKFAVAGVETQSIKLGTMFQLKNIPVLSLNTVIATIVRLLSQGMSGI